MEKFDLINPNEVRILYYQNPSHFYVYLRQKINSHAQFQVELQRAMENYQSVSTIPQYQRYQPVVAQDNHAIWHRAMILSKLFFSFFNKLFFSKILIVIQLIFAFISLMLVKKKTFLSPIFVHYHRNSIGNPLLPFHVVYMKYIH
jgi:hypothetical protein